MNDPTKNIKCNDRESPTSGALNCISFSEATSVIASTMVSTWDNGWGGSWGLGGKIILDATLLAKIGGTRGHCMGGWDGHDGGSGKRSHPMDCTRNGSTIGD